MSEKIERKVIVTGAKRGNNKGGSGNPSYTLETDNGRFLTAENSQAAFAVENDFHVGEKLNVPATLHLNKKGDVIGWELDS